MGALDWYDLALCFDKIKSENSMPLPRAKLRRLSNGTMHTYVSQIHGISPMVEEAFGNHMSSLGGEHL